MRKVLGSKWWQRIRTPIDVAWRIRWKGREWVCPLPRQRAIILHLALALVVVIASIQLRSKVTPPESPMASSIQATLVMTAPSTVRQAEPVSRWVRPPEVQSVKRPVERSVERPVAHRIEKPTERPAEKPIERPIERPLERPLPRSKPESKPVPPKPHPKLKPKQPVQDRQALDRKIEAEKARAEDEKRQKMLDTLKAFGATSLNTSVAAQSKAAAQSVQDLSLRDQFLALIRQEITHNWNNPFRGEGENYQVILIIVLNDAGVVQSVQVQRSSGNPTFDRQVILAVWRSSPLPVPTDVSVRANWFQTLTLQFSNT